jgi:hypothetical protein
MRDDVAIKAACLQAAATMVAADKVIAFEKAGNDAARAKAVAQFARELLTAWGKAAP